MARWLISVPAWGERCVEVLCATALPALERAVVEMARAGGPDDVRLVAHTDSPARVRGGATQLAVEARPVPAGLRDFDCLSQAHREVLGMACAGDVVVLLTADLVLSEGGLLYCARALEDPQKLLVACAGVRALQEGQLPGTTSAPELMRWAWEHHHPMTEACLWPGGLSQDLSRLYFEREDSVVAHLALPHPLAVRADGRPLRFAPTVDANLIQCFDPSEIHMVQSANELALVELSPPDKEFQVCTEAVEARHAAGEFHLGDPMQRWCFEHKVVLCGAGGDCGDDAVVKNLTEDAR